MKIIICLLFIAFCCSLSEFEFKSLQGPPDEFNEHLLPKPEENPLISDSGIVPIYFRKVSENEYEWNDLIPCDSEDYFSISVVSHLKDLKVQIESHIPINPTVTKGFFGLGKASIPTTTYSYRNTKENIGSWKAKIVYNGKIEDLSRSHVSLIIENRSLLQIGSYLNSYKTIVGNEVGVYTKLFSAKSFNKTETKLPKGIKLNNNLVDLQITLPDGEVRLIEMKDNANKNNEGTYSGKITATKKGTYISQVRMHGFRDGVEFYRTTQHLMNVIEENFELLPVALGEERDDFIIITLQATEKSKNLLNNKFKAYAEVWGTNNGVKVPIAWVGGMVLSKTIKNKLSFQLKLNMKWLSKAGVIPDELRNVYIQHAAYSVTISQLNTVKLQLEKNINLSKIKFNGVVTEDMIFGKRPVQFLHKYKKNGNGKVILSHGYCADKNPFTPSEFTDYSEFHDPNQSRTIDEFALLLKDHASKFPEGVSFVVHSMGGHASLHLFSFYWSSTDLLFNYENRTKSNGHIIQTVGTPWLGSGLAGNLAELGRSLGIGCGNNKDLTYDGSKNWMTLIPKTARQEVKFYTTQYADWSWCNIAVNAVLTWPNDGTTENKYASLADGQNGGHTKGQCHTGGMNYPPQTQDSNRNKILNQNARRSF